MADDTAVERAREPTLRQRVNAGRADGETGTTSQEGVSSTSARDAPSEETKPAAAAEASAPSATESGDSGEGPSTSKEGGGFECNICLETASDAVVSHCGHLYCWPCLHNWLEYQGPRATCPVCKAAIGRDKVVPLYGRGKTNQRDPRDKPLPQRPQAQRTEAEPPRGPPHFHGPFAGAQFAPHVAGAQAQFSFGFGMFPSLFGLQFTTFPMTGVFPNQGGRELTAVEAQQAMLSRLLLMLGSFIIVMLLLY